MKRNKRIKYNDKISSRAPCGHPVPMGTRQPEGRQDASTVPPGGDNR